jgi:ABC-2 type transport system permease protein
MIQVQHLLKLQLNEKFAHNSKNPVQSFWKKEIIPRAVAIVIITVAVFLILKIANMLVALGTTQELLGFILFAVQLITFGLALGNIITNLYFSKDNEFLMGMPVKPTEVFLVKVIVLYIYEFIVDAVFILPIMLAYGLINGAGFWFFLSILPMLVLLPAIPLLLATIVSIPVVYIIFFLKTRFILSIITILGLTVSLFYIYMRFISTIADSISIIGHTIALNMKVQEMSRQVLNVTYIYQILTDIMYGKNILLNLTIAIALVLGAVAFVILIVKPIYFRVCMQQMETSQRKFKKVRRFKRHSQLFSIMWKDYLVLLRSPGYIFQFFLFALMMPFVVYLYNRLLLSISVREVGAKMILGANILIISIMALISNTVSASAISREGGNFYIMKVSPVPYYKQALAKIIFNCIIVVTSIFLTGIVCIAFTSMTILQAILSFGFASILSVGHICWSFEYDLTTPILDWYDTSEITKNNRNTNRSMGIGIILAIGIGSIAIANFYNEAEWWTWTFLYYYAVIIAVIRIIILKVKINYYFQNMEI